MTATVDLIELERSLWQPATRNDRDHMNRILHDAFVEIGASGAVHDRAACLDAVGLDDTVELSGFEVTRLSEGAFLVTYVSMDHQPVGPRRAHRSSIWIETNGVLRLRFHQGTLAPRSDDSSVSLT